MKATIFTPEELEELRRFDAMVDELPMTREDWKALALVEDLLFPERVAVRAANHARYLRRREAVAVGGKAYREANQRGAGCGVRYPCLTGRDSGPFSCDAEAAGFGGLAEGGIGIRHDLLHGGGIEAGGLNRFPGHPVFTGP